MKKLILVLLILGVLISGGLYAFARKAPGLVRDALERSINKTVRIDAVEYKFPWTFKLQGFQILETQEPFAGEVCFAVDQVLLDVSPLSLSRSRFILDNVDVSGARVVVRKRGGKLMHALSKAMGISGESSGESTHAKTSPKSALPLVIHRFHLSQSSFKFMDYDVQETGFVVELDQIEAKIGNISFPPTSSKTNYRIDARLLQGRQQRSARLNISGWTQIDDYETDAQLHATDLLLPYFRPYYGQVTPAEIEDGHLSSRAALRIHNQLFTGDVDLELVGLYFRGYEEGGELFGLKADQILPFLKDSSGRLKFHIILQWDLADHGLEKKLVIRRAIEQSLKKTLLGNVGGILEKTLLKFADSDGAPSKEDWDDTLKKVKKLFR